MNRVFLLAVFVVLLFPDTAPVSAQERKTAFSDSLKTIAGELEIVELIDNCKFNVTLNGKVVFKTDCEDESNEYQTEPIPAIHTFYKSTYEAIAPFDEVVLLQQGMLGNACDGGSLLFLGLKRDGSFQLSKPIAFCGGRQPVITWGGNKVTVLIPGGPPNRGTGRIPPETWIYERGMVRRVANNKRRRQHSR